MNIKALRLVSPLKKVSLPVPAFGLRMLVLAVGLLWLVSLGLGYAAQLATYFEAPEWVSPGLRLLGYIANFVAVLLVFYKLYGLTVHLGLFLWGLISPTEPVELSLNPEPAPPAEPLLAQMNETMERVELDLEAYLATLDQENSATQSILADLQTRALTLVELAERFSQRAEEHFRRKRLLEEARTVIKVVVSGETNTLEQVREYAGQVNDPVMARMLLSQTQDKEHWLAVREHLSLEMGILTEFERASRSYGYKLLRQVSQTRQRTALAESSLWYRETQRPLLESLRQLEQVGQILQLQVGQVDGSELPAALPRPTVPTSLMASR
jgi:hypothetical protein